MSKTIKVRGWRAENCKRMDDSIDLIETNSGQSISAEQADKILSSSSFYGMTPDNYVHAEVPVTLALEQSLENRDWYTGYSDDYSVWRRGQEHSEYISRLMEMLPRDEAKEIWNKHCPAEMRMK